jgi:hypothetical protein
MAVGPDIFHTSAQDSLDSLFHEVGHAVSERLPEEQRRALGVLTFPEQVEFIRNPSAQGLQYMKNARERVDVFGKTGDEQFAEDFARALLEPKSAQTGMMQLRRILR